MTSQRDIANLEWRITAVVDRVIYNQQGEWSKWGGLVIDRFNLRNLICDAVLAEIERTFPVDKVAIEGEEKQ